jgi:PIN domain nuclease of toxin-antitoxin system
MGGVYLNPKRYLLDTHAMIFWSSKEWVSHDFLMFFDQQAAKGNVLASTVSFWEVALLSKKNKIRIKNVHEWKSGLMENTNIRMIHPSASDMIDSTLLPDFHKDPFDRLLVVQANRHKAYLVTQDSRILDYSVKTFWL